MEDVPLCSEHIDATCHLDDAGELECVACRADKADAEVERLRDLQIQHIAEIVDMEVKLGKLRELARAVMEKRGGVFEGWKIRTVETFPPQAGIEYPTEVEYGDMAKMKELIKAIDAMAAALPKEEAK